MLMPQEILPWVLAVAISPPSALVDDMMEKTMAMIPVGNSSLLDKQLKNNVMHEETGIDGRRTVYIKPITYCPTLPINK